MRSLVIFDSEFGNTREIAETIAAELQTSGLVDVHKVGTPGAQVISPNSVDLLIVGGPTQMHGVSPGMREFLATFHRGSLARVPTAVFDTRLAGWPLFTGAASGGIAKLLERSGASLVVAPESFIVSGREGPLAEGEVERARTWARQILAVVPQPVTM